MTRHLPGHPSIAANERGDGERTAGGLPTPADGPVGDLYGGRHLTKGVLWTLASTGLPLAASLFAFPFLVDSLGIERFGVLTLVWLIVGYFGLVELGIGAALTKIIAEKRALGEVDGIASLTWSALVLLAVLGVAGTGLVAGLAPWLVHDVLTIARPLQAEALRTFFLVSLSLPVLTAGAAFNGMLAAYQRFGLISAVEMPIGLMNLLGPVAVLLFVDSLPLAAVSVVLAQFFGLIVSYQICIRVEPALSRPGRLSIGTLKPLLRLGGWMTVTRIVGPLMVYFDRFLIGAFISISAVGYYSTAYGLVTRMWIVPAALARVLLPTLSSLLAQESARAGALAGTGVKAIFLSLFPACLVVIVFAFEGLDLWLGAEFAVHGGPVLQWLCIGVLINSLAHIPFVLLQSAGRPDLTAKLHLCELIPYLLLLLVLVESHGITGAAIAWTIRVIVDTIVLFFLGGRLVPGTVGPVMRAMGAVAAGIFAIGLCLLLSGLWIKVAVVGLVLIAYPVVAWVLVLDRGERSYFREMLGGRRSNDAMPGAAMSGGPDADSRAKADPQS